MNIREFSQNLLILYEEMGTTFSSYQKSTELHCLSGCGFCCTNPEVEASVLEMLPMALKIWDENTWESWLRKLEHSNTHCLIYEAHSPDLKKGRCGSYKERPSICRIFGVAGRLDKNQNLQLSVCKYIKEANPELVQEKKEQAKKEETPIMADWMHKLSQLDPQLTAQKMPINQALKIAIEKVALYASYSENF